jgi:methionyl-tRNA synthetase
MSKSLGTAVDPIEAANRFGADPLRLFLVKEIAFGGDGDFTWERYDERYNTDLANNLGNLVSRVVTMAHRYRNGRLAPATGPSDQLVRLAEQVVNDYKRAMETFAIHEAAAAAYRLVDATNEFIAATSPWLLAKDPSAAGHLSQVLFDSAEAIRLSAVLLSPVMPTAAKEILRRVGGSTGALTFDRDGYWRADGERALVLDPPLWPRKELTTVSDVPLPPDAPAPGARVETPPPMPTRITIDDFMKVELRVAKVLGAERVPKSKKLLKLNVDVGVEQRTLVAGIADAYDPDALVGRTVVIVFNLQPATLMGVESNGMVLAASPEGGKPMLLSFDDPPPPGTRIR